MWQVGSCTIDERQIHDVNEMDSHQFRHLLRLLLGLTLFVYALYALYIHMYVVYTYLNKSVCDVQHGKTLRCL